MYRKNSTLSVLILLILLNSCGFKKINDNNPLVYIQKINISGDDRDTYMLKNNIFLISKKEAENKYNIDIKLSKNKSSKIKNKAGKVTRYTLGTTVDLSIENIKTLAVNEKIFSKSNDYDVAKNHSDTLNNQKNASEANIKQLSDEIKNYIILFNKN
tara:strand:- start:7673 stop:8143 length:471 start_codon:yes stop_codon:yes gene_type:complete